MALIKALSDRASDYIGNKSLAKDIFSTIQDEIPKITIQIDSDIIDISSQLYFTIYSF